MKDHRNVDGRSHLSLSATALRLHCGYTATQHLVLKGLLVGRRVNGHMWVDEESIEHLEQSGGVAELHAERQRHHLQQLAAARAKPERLERLRNSPWTPERAAQLAAARERARVKREASKPKGT